MQFYIAGSGVMHSFSKGIFITYGRQCHYYNLQEPNLDMRAL